MFEVRHVRVRRVALALMLLLRIAYRCGSLAVTPSCVRTVQAVR